MENALEIKKVSKVYKTKKGDIQALEDISFNVKKGEFFGLLGPNGAGKTTLINIIEGVAKKTSGSVSVLGANIDEDLVSVKKSIGVVTQELAFEAFFNVELSLRFQFGYYGQKVDEAYLNEILDRLSLSEKRKAKPMELSGGMKRRLMIARALVHRPKVIILDEPTAGVDIELRHDLYKLLRELNEDGVTIILTSHYLEEVEFLCERVGIIHKGALVALDQKEELKNRFESKRVFSIALSKKLNQIPSIFKDFDPKMEGSELKLHFDESEYQKILQLVGKMKLPVANFRIIEPSLEDVFLKFTE